MRHVLANAHLRLEIDSLGAELKSCRDPANGREYLWQADPAYWNRTSPVLFPIVGSLTGKTCTIHGRPYTLPQHGLARDLEFALVEQREDRLGFELHPTAATRAHYPFDFTLRIDYVLDGDTVTNTWTVLNHGADIMPFSIGAHPGFSTQLMPGDTFEDYEIRLDRACALHLWTLNERGQFHTGTTPFRDGQALEAFVLDYRDYAVDALVFPHRQLEAVTLRHRGHGHGVRVEFPGFPVLALWTGTHGGSRQPPFLCVEPWFGHADTVDGPFELSEKPGILQLPPGESFQAAYRMRFF
jgi:galactose mutarotase-like enzyme